VRYILAVVAAIFLASGLVQLVLSTLTTDVGSVVGALFQLTVGVVLVVVLRRLRRKYYKTERRQQLAKGRSKVR